MAKIKVHITGKVQGVSFRYSARQQAQSMHISGWIKNLADGNILIEASGLKASLLTFIDWCKQGPPHAQVERATIEWLDEHDGDQNSTGADFQIIG